MVHIWGQNIGIGTSTSTTVIPIWGGTVHIVCTTVYTPFVLTALALQAVEDSGRYGESA